MIYVLQRVRWNEYRYNSEEKFVSHIINSDYPQERVELLVKNCTYWTKELLQACKTTEPGTISWLRTIDPLVENNKNIKPRRDDLIAKAIQRNFLYWAIISKNI